MSNFKTYIIPSENNKKDKRFEKLKLDFHGLKPPFVLLLMGACGCGKTSYTYSIAKNFKKYYDIMLVYSTTRDSKKSWEDLASKKLDVVVKNIFNNDEIEDFLNDIQESNMERISEGDRPLNTLLIFDDMIFSNTINKIKGNVIDKIISIHRHKDINISLVFCSQSYTACSRNLRLLNCSAVMVFEVNSTDLQKIAEEHCGLLDADEFIEVFKNLRRSKKYVPFVINYKKGLGDRFSFNNQKIVVKK